MSVKLRKREQKKKKGQTHNLHDSVSYLDKQSEVPAELNEKYTKFVVHLASEDTDVTSKFKSGKDWRDHILKIRKIYKCHPRKAQMHKLYEEAVLRGAISDRNYNFEQYLQIRSSRSLSGILVIAVLMAPFPTYIDKRTGTNFLYMLQLTHALFVVYDFRKEETAKVFVQTQLLLLSK